ncbi:MAG: hypothetical protein AB7I04_13130 [Pseudomonadales bacterium]
MKRSRSVLARSLKQSLIGMSIVGAGLAAYGVHAKPNVDTPPPNVNSVAIYQVQWGPGCSTFTVNASLNEAGNTKDISNIVLACGTDADGNVTWNKWEFGEGSSYVFGTALPGGLDPTEGSGCTGPITTAYVKAGSKKSGKGIEGVDPKEFNGHVGGRIDCDPSPPTDG